MATSTPNKTKRKSQQRTAVIRLLVMVAILICVNLLAGRFHYGLDLTKEKRFTLSNATKRLLSGMKDVAVVEVYLEGGDFPAGFQRLRASTREKLQALREYSGGNLVFRFTDPVAGKGQQEKLKIYDQMAEKGMMAVNLQQKGDEGYSEQYVMPYALVKYNGKEYPVKLLETNPSLSAFDNLNYSEALLEYKIASAINKLQYPVRTEIAYIMGHGESLGIHTFDLLTTLSMHYKVDTIDLSSSLQIPSYYKAIIVNKPTQPINDKDKFKIDQYVMKGGRVLWAVDMLRTPMDSLQRNKQFITTDYALNLDDQLFKYGVRINTNLVEDMQQCLQMPVTVGESGGRPQFQLRPWIYFPFFVPSSSHPIVKNMDAVMGQFVNSIDTVANPEIKKTILLESSKYSRTTASPTRVSISMLMYPPKAELFNKPHQPVAVLLEGKFISVFKNRLDPSFLITLRDSLHMAFKEEADSATRMIVISDGDMLLNDYTQRTGPMEMGYWQFTGDRFANKEFILNCLEYLTDNSGLIEARSKDVRLRLLDVARAKKERTTWQVVNIGIPLALVLVFASAYIFFRKRKYAVKAK
ncbi:MAG: gliding motility-associated ABC transporter substrate-binding protein GldG [Sphingobacteriales bacterium]|nr:MAG: gliding motility-associated ABC transporter substrate-binding protein GldG [Sphingobacteriales bacterium]